MTLLYLVRHAEQERARAEDPSVGLSGRGREQARLLGRRLRGVPFDGIHHSPLARAEETARIVAESLPGVPMSSSLHLADRTPVPSPGREADYSARHLEWLATVPAEERDVDGVRLAAAWRHFAGLGGREPAGTGSTRPGCHLLVTHAFVVGAFVREALEAPARTWLSLESSHCGLTVIRCPPGRPAALVGFNDVGHLWVEKPALVDPRSPD